TAAPANVAQPAPPSTVTPATRPVAPANSAPAPADGKTALATTSQPAASGDTTESRQAEDFIRKRDRNQNKTVDPEEWAITRTLRPMFEQAGVDLTQAMSHEQFVQSYVRVVAAERK